MDEKAEAEPEIAKNCSSQVLSFKHVPQTNMVVTELK